MMIWELALLLVAITYMVVNTAYTIASLKILAKYDGIFTKSIGIMEKMLGHFEQQFDEDDD